MGEDTPALIPADMPVCNVGGMSDQRRRELCDIGGSWQTVAGDCVTGG